MAQLRGEVLQRAVDIEIVVACILWHRKREDDLLRALIADTRSFFDKVQALGAMGVGQDLLTKLARLVRIRNVMAHAGLIAIDNHGYGGPVDLKKFKLAAPEFLDLTSLGDEFRALADLVEPALYKQTQVLGIDNLRP